jgi:DeoD family purine-nucleoside phosphorylase
VLLPGDPVRAAHIAERFLQSPRSVNDERGLLGFTGSYGGRPVSVQATGMGCPSTSIVVEELVTLGARNLLRVGTCGAYDARLGFGDLIVATAASAAAGTVSAYTRGLPYAPTAHFDVVHAAFHAAESRRIRPWVGPLVTSDVFYDPDRDQPARWAALGVLGVEMEAAALFTVAAMRGARAGCMVTVSDVLHGGDPERIGDAALRSGVDRMIGLALETLAQLD